MPLSGSAKLKPEDCDGCRIEGKAHEGIVDAMLVDSVSATASVFFTLATVEPPCILAENRGLVLLLEILTV
jgi:hypothetical protein